MLMKSCNGIGIFKVNGVFICMGIRSKEIYCVGSMEKCTACLEAKREVLA